MSNLFWLTTSFVFGTIIGSFINVAILRGEKEESLNGRSHCMTCGHILSPWDLVPVFSYLFLKRRCRYCHQPISSFYFWNELLVGSAFALIVGRILRFSFVGSILRYATFGAGEKIMLFSQIIFWLAFFSVLIAIAVFDLRNYLIPDTFIYTASGILALNLLTKLALSFTKTKWFYLHSGLKFLGTNEAVFFAGNEWIGILIGAIIGFVVLGLLAYGSHGKAMGYGDPILGLLLGAAFGPVGIVLVLTIAFLLGGIIGAVLISFKRKGFRSLLPFAPFLVVSSLLVFLLGDHILAFYVKIFGLIV
jgi:prepilin signal peptidase PulO-like enzyme (type II secretory pathway)